MNNRKVGEKYEIAAADYLTSAGWQILNRNYRGRAGEIDIIAKDGGCLVFVEVKYRRSSAFGDPAEAVDLRKQQRIRRTSLQYLWENGYGEDTFCRFDVVVILANSVRLIRDAF